MRVGSTVWASGHKAHLVFCLCSRTGARVSGLSVPAAGKFAKRMGLRKKPIRLATFRHHLCRLGKTKTTCELVHLVHSKGRREGSLSVCDQGSNTLKGLSAPPVPPWIGDEHERIAFAAGHSCARCFTVEAGNIGAGVPCMIRGVILAVWPGMLTG